MAYNGQPILTRTRNIALKTEATLGTVEALTAAEAAIISENPEILYDADATEIRPVGTFGVHQIVAGARPAAMNFDWRLYTGSTAPAFLDTLFEAAGLIRAGAVYTHQLNQCSANGVSGAVWDGVGATARRSLISGAFADLTFNFQVGQPVTINVALSGKMPSVPAADTAPDPTFPLPTYPRFAGAALTLDSSEFLLDGFTLKLNNVIQLLPLPGAADASGYFAAWIVDASPSITIAPEAAAFSLANFYDKFYANTAIAFSAVVGTAANNIITFAAPRLMLTRPPGRGERDGRLTDTLELRATKSNSGYSGGLTITLS